MAVNPADINYFMKPHFLVLAIVSGLRPSGASGHIVFLEWGKLCLLFQGLGFIIKKMSSWSKQAQSIFYEHKKCPDKSSQSHSHTQCQGCPTRLLSRPTGSLTQTSQSLHHNYSYNQGHSQTKWRVDFGAGFSLILGVLLFLQHFQAFVTRTD